MALRDQDRARLAFEHVSRYEPQSPQAKKYASMVHALPALLRSAGLCQALHFVASRKNESQRALLEDLARQLRRVNERSTSGEALLALAREADLTEYLRLTQEAIACSSWYRRLVQAVLKIDMAEADREGEER
jgi:CRISPR-associated protein Cmr5